MNNYLIVTSDKITLDEKIKEINKNKDSEIIYYDLTEVKIDKILEELNSYNFLSPSKIVIGTNAFFLSSERIKSSVEFTDDDKEKLEKYLNNPNSENSLILVLNNNSLDKRKKIVSNILDKMELVEETNNIESIIKKRLDGFKMDNSTINKLISYCRNDNEKILNELEKLKMYKIDTKEIKSEDIDSIVSKSLDDNIFSFADSILKGNKKYAFTLYNNFILHGEKIFTMLSIISNKIRLIYQVKILSEDGKSDKEISKLLKVHEYPVKLARESSYSYSERRLLKIINDLSKLDLEIKSGETTGEVEFELLLASI